MYKKVFGGQIVLFGGEPSLLPPSRLNPVYNFKSVACTKYYLYEKLGLKLCMHALGVDYWSIKFDMSKLSVCLL